MSNRHALGAAFASGARRLFQPTDPLRYDFVGLFLQTLLTAPFTFVIIVGFAIKSGDFCPAEALQVVCSVDDGPKTDWQVVRVSGLLLSVQVGNQFK
jgi:hypothetical protein